MQTEPAGELEQVEETPSQRRSSSEIPSLDGIPSARGSWSDEQERLDEDGDQEAAQVMTMLSTQSVGLTQEQPGDGFQTVLSKSKKRALASSKYAPDRKTRAAAAAPYSKTKK